MTRSDSDPLRIVVMISGRGSNLDAMIQNIQQGKLKAQIVGVLSSNAQAAGLQFAYAAKIPVTVIDRAAMTSRSAFNQRLAESLDLLDADLVVLAGFMHILDDDLVNRYLGRMVNVHPSLLPRYRGLQTYRRALAAGDKFHGTSVHFVTCELDGGPVVLQVRIAINHDDTEQTLANRVQTCEHLVYSKVINWFTEKRLEFADNQALLDGKPLLEPVIMDETDVLDGSCESN